MSKVKKIAASEARNNFSELVSQVQYQEMVFLIERYGEVVAKLVPVEKAETGLGKVVEIESNSAELTQPEQQGSLAALEKLIRQSKESAGTTKPEQTQMATPPRIPIKRLETEEPVAFDPSLRPSGLAEVKPMGEIEQSGQDEQEKDVAQRKAERIEIIRKKIELLMED